MKLGQKVKTIQILGNKMNNNHTIGSKMKSLIINKIAHEIEKKDENPKSFLEKR